MSLPASIDGLAQLGESFMGEHHDNRVVKIVYEYMASLGSENIKLLIESFTLGNFGKDEISKALITYIHDEVQELKNDEHSVSDLHEFVDNVNIMCNNNNQIQTVKEYMSDVLDNHENEVHP